MRGLMRAIAILLGLAAGPAAAGAMRPEAPPGPLDGAGSWAVFYGAQAPAAALQAPDLLVLEPDHPWRPQALRREGQRVLAYLSLGEVHRTRPYFGRLERAGVLAGANPNWPGAVMVDPRSRLWQEMVVSEIMPAILAKGYDGLFLDTLDVAAHLEAQRPGATAAMRELLSAMHARHPEALLVANGGLALLPEAAPALAGLAVESVFTDYDFAASRYRLRAPEEANRRKEAFQALARRHGLRVFVLEYAEEPEMRRRARQLAAEAGFVPFVSDIGLETLEP